MSIESKGINRVVASRTPVSDVRTGQWDGDIRHRIIRAVYIVVVEKASNYTEQELYEELRDV